MTLKILVGAVVAFLLLGIGVGFYRSIPTSQIAQTAMQPNAITSVTIGTTTLTVEVEDTDASREQGLSGRVSLDVNTGMLFVFDTPGAYGFWMKDMNFALDMLFIDSSGTIVTVDQNISPDTYHQSPPQVFKPARPVTYVLEVPAGFAVKNKIIEGMQVTFNQ